MRIASLLIGAAVAAFVILPARAADAWVNGPWKTYDAKALKLEGVVANVKVDVKDSGPMVVQVSGNPERVNGVHVDVSNGTLRIECSNPGSVWDWQHWFDFSHARQDRPSQLRIVVAVPRGSAVAVETIAGNVVIGSTQGPLKFEADGYTESAVGDVSEAHLEMAGSGKLTVGKVSGAVRAETAGSGDIRIGDVASVDADIAGSGSISVANVNGPIKVDIAGSGNFTAASVHGPTSADIAGSGSVSIGGGEANPLRVDIMGSGELTLNGTAVNPKVDSMGSGSVKVKACRGTGCNDRDLKVGG